MELFFAVWIGTLLHYCQATIYTNDWALRISQGYESATRIADKYGFTNMGQMQNRKNYYIFHHHETAPRSTVPNNALTARITKETEVEWLQQQVIQKRVKRSLYSFNRMKPKCGESHHQHLKDNQWDNLCSDDFKGHQPPMNIGEAWRRGYTGRGVVVSILDYSIDGEHPNLKMNYDALASFEVNGQERLTPPSYSETAANYHGTRCAAMVAGAISTNRSLCSMGVAFRSRIGGIRMLEGVDGEVTDMVEAQALNFQPQHVDIYLAGWGPEDDGTTVDGPGPLARLALRTGVQTADAGAVCLRDADIKFSTEATIGESWGRHGRGSVYVWASGSGGRRGDHCSCDGYANSIYTISIGSGGVDEERCSSTLATASATHEINCGTAKWGSALSASAAAGVIALTLEAKYCRHYLKQWSPNYSRKGRSGCRFSFQPKPHWLNCLCLIGWNKNLHPQQPSRTGLETSDVNPLLTWRDIQHIIVWTSDYRKLAAADWKTNGAGHKVSHLYGFGLLDAERMVMQAKGWRRVPPQRACTVKARTQLKRISNENGVLTSTLEASGCSASFRRRQNVAFVEHVVARVTLACRRRGNLTIELTSPLGTVSRLLDKRPYDNSTEGFHQWEFMTTHCWGEQASGEWTLNIRDSPSEGRENSPTGILQEWSLVIYGTAGPVHPVSHRLVRSPETPEDANFTEEYAGSCNPECSDDGCDGPSQWECVTCAHFFLKFKNNTRVCVSMCPRGFWADRRRCKRCYAACESCTGSRSDQCTSCQDGYHLTEGTNTCTDVCEESYFLDHDAKMCRKCSEMCLVCMSSSICTECKADSSLRGNRCQWNCPSGMYYNEAEGACKPCHPVCADCAGPDVEACTRCANGYLMEEWKCVASCSRGFFSTNSEIADGHEMCRRCDASCLTCVGPSWGNCSSCSSGHSLQEGECVLHMPCADGEYQDNNETCQPCHPTCLKCTGPWHQECISCVTSHVLDEGHCLTECAQGKYPGSGRCHLCDHTCATCVEGGPAKCTSCNTDKFGMARYFHKGSCVEACPEAFYHTEERTCEPCSQHCTLCMSSTHCLRCNSSYSVDDGTCAKLECGEGEVEDPDYRNCMACEEGCKHCVLYNPKHCLSCKEGFYNLQDSCYKNCPAKTYSVDEVMTCVPCDDNCVSCDQHECYWCETDLFLSDGYCVSVCPEGFYGDEDTNECEECHATCASCSGREDDDCMFCDDGKSLENGKCMTDNMCPMKTFLSDDGQCVECHPSCKSCSGKNKNQCTKCPKEHFLSPQKTCVTKCPPGSFGERLSGECEACPVGCLYCVDLEHCTRCLSRSMTFFLQDGQCVQQCVRGYPVGQVCRNCASDCASCEKNASYCLSCEEPLLLLNHQCVEQCPPNHVVHVQECRPCPAACEECDPLGECAACEEYHFLHEGTCVLDCPDGFFGDHERRECLGCHPSCRLCDGSGHDDCDACVNPRDILRDGECLTKCPARTFVDDETGECQECDISCLTCTGPRADSCTDCREGYGLAGHGRCVPSDDECSRHEYLDERGKCRLCHKNCRRCFGPGKNRCLDCKQRYLLLNGSCVDECPAGFYADQLRQKCETCHPTCRSCSGKESHECLNCKDGLFRQGRECVETCQRSHYGNRNSGTCEACDPNCGECTGDGACLSCVAGLVLMPQEGRCLHHCPGGFYQHRDDHGMTADCERCHSNCATCSGKSTHCESCGPGYILSGNTCLSACDTNKYPLTKGSSHSCEDCHPSCMRCKGPGATNCSACPPYAILESEGRCLLCCHTAGSYTHHCCNCTETTGVCILSNNLPFRNEEGDNEGEGRGNLAVFIITSILLAAGLVAAIVLIRRSRSKRTSSDGTPCGYEKLDSASGSASGGHGSSSSCYKGTQMVDLGKRSADAKDREDEEEEEDIVYMSKDGTVYRKFRYGQLGEDDDDLEYDDERYMYR